VTVSSSVAIIPFPSVSPSSIDVDEAPSSSAAGKAFWWASGYVSSALVAIGNIAVRFMASPEQAKPAMHPFFDTTDFARQLNDISHEPSKGSATLKMGAKSTAEFLQKSYEVSSSQKLDLPEACVTAQEVVPSAACTTLQQPITSQDQAALQEYTLQEYTALQEKRAALQAKMALTQQDIMRNTISRLP
jgi:hypothetical protein